MKKTLFILLAVALVAAIPTGIVCAKQATIEIGRGYEGPGSSFTYSKTWDGDDWDCVNFYATVSFEGTLEVKDEGLMYLKPPTYVTVIAEIGDEDRIFKILIRTQGRPVMYLPDKDLIYAYGDAEIVGTGIKGIVIIKDQLCDNGDGQIYGEFKFYGYSNPEKAWVVIEAGYGECEDGGNGGNS
jgi:hypothetical protein